MLRFAGQEAETEFELIRVGLSEEKKSKPSVKRKPHSYRISKKRPKIPVLQPAWTDDDELQPDLMRPPPALDVRSCIDKHEDVQGYSSESDLDRAITCTSQILQTDKTEFLPHTRTLEIRRVFDANRQRLCVGALTSVHFNTRYRMLLTACEDSTLAFFKVDGIDNDLLKDRVFEKFPLSSAKFAPDGERAVITGNKSLFRVYDLETSKETRSSPFMGCLLDEVLNQCEVASEQPNMIALGTNTSNVYLADLRTLEKINVVQTKEELRSFAFAGNGICLTTLDASGQVNIFDLRNRKPRMVHYWADQASTGGTALGCSSDGRWIACGSDFGFVNVYKWSETVSKTYPEPDKSITNLRTGVNLLAFHPRSEMIILGSSKARAAVRLYHIQAHQVFENFPLHTGTLGYPTSVAFSPNGGYLCIGQANGRAALYHIVHYDDY
ncbi:unnamed protein product [Calicophoron daubneyi]|uniref:Uncharacterized protein n=1 Tax=Calicophoron daubneyi TaxID=300641 RepID=A0AAV2T4U2_CALDB